MHKNLKKIALKNEFINYRNFSPLVGETGGGEEVIMFIMLAVQYVAGTPTHYLPCFDTGNGNLPVAAKYFMLQ